MSLGSENNSEQIGTHVARDGVPTPDRVQVAAGKAKHAKAGGKGNGRGAPAPTRVASVQKQGEQYVVLIGERSGERVSVVARSILESDWKTFAATLVMEGVGRVVRVIPGAATISRVGAVPSADTVQMTQAATLLAEVQMPDSIPAHRRGAGVLVGHGEGATIPALLVGWRGAPASDNSIPSEIAQQWCPVIASLACLRSTSAGPIWFADPSDGSISVLSGTGANVSARVVVEDNSSALLWGEGVAATVGVELEEAAMKTRLGIREAEIEGLAARVSVVGAGGGLDGAWLDVHGAALGALLIAMEKDPALAALALLTAVPPKVQEHPVLRVASWLGDSRHATWVIAASLVLLVGAPLGVAWARVAILDSKYKSLAKASETRKELDKRAAVYAELSATRWPMTKLLSDISRATPQGVVVAELLIQPEIGLAAGGAEKGITLKGTADSQTKVNDFQTNLNKSGLFRGVQVGQTEVKGDGGVTFGLTFGIANPHGTIPANEDWDWAKKNIAVRLYGEGASVKTPPAGKAGAGNGEDRPTRRASRVDDTGEDKGDAKATAKKDSTGIPVALTDEQISKFDRGGAMREMASRRKYSQQNPSLDSSTKRRLEDEVVKLRERMEVLRTAGGKAEPK